MLRQRLITAALLIPFMVWDILHLPFTILAGVLGMFVLLATWEWAGICGWQSWRGKSVYTVIMGSILLTIYWFWPQLALTYLLAIAGFGWLLALVGVISYQQGYDLMPKSLWIKACLGLFILIPAWVALLLLDERYDGQAVLFLLVLIWVADSGAFFVGKYFGRNKLADKISPGKTWEGVAGALLSSMPIALGYANFLSMTLTTIIWFMGLCLVTVIASILGDLLESLFKRQMGLKDSSQLLPGHGGILDRIDSLTSAAPVFVFGLITLGIVL
jgi:phosphatidate cytidylyltransferase